MKNYTLSQTTLQYQLNKQKKNQYVYIVRNLLKNAIYEKKFKLCQNFEHLINLMGTFGFFFFLLNFLEIKQLTIHFIINSISYFLILIFYDNSTYLCSLHTIT